MSERQAENGPERQASSESALPSDAFQTTHWSLVLHAGTQSTLESQEAMAQLCQAYWWPLYCYVRRRVRDQHEAQDLTQAFFARLLEKDYLSSADPLRGKFRAFLLTALKRFMANDLAKQHALKRGGKRTKLSLDFGEGERLYAQQAADASSADQIFLRDWARALLDRVRTQLRSEFKAAGKSEQFRELEVFITPQPDSTKAAEVADRLQISEAAVRVAAHRMRERYRRLLREEIAQTVTDPNEIEEEIRNLFAAFSQA